MVIKIQINREKEYTVDEVVCRYDRYLGIDYVVSCKDLHPKGYGNTIEEAVEDLIENAKMSLDT